MPNVGAVGDKPVGIHHSSIQADESPQLHLLAMCVNLSHKLAVDALPHTVERIYKTVFLIRKTRNAKPINNKRQAWQRANHQFLETQIRAQLMQSEQHTVGKRLRCAPLQGATLPQLAHKPLFNARILPRSMLYFDKQRNVFAFCAIVLNQVKHLLQSGYALIGGVSVLVNDVETLDFVEC